jgi:hypothetical protein
LLHPQLLWINELDRFSYLNTLKIGLKILETHLKMDINAFLNTLDDSLLESLTLTDVALPFEKSKLKYISMDKTTFENLTLENLKEDNSEQMIIIKERLDKNARFEPLQIPSLELPKDLNKLPLQQVRWLSADTIGKIAAEFPSKAFEFFSNEQLVNLKLFQLNPEQTEVLFKLPKELIAARLKIFENQDVIDALYAQKLSGPVLEHLSNDHLKALKLSELDSNIIYQMFPQKEDNTEDKERFSHFDASDVQAAIKKGFLAGGYRLSLLSNDHLKALKLSELNSNIIYQMFPQKEDNTEDKERFSHFDASDVQAAIKKGFLAGDYRLSLLSNDHLKALKLSELDSSIIYQMFPQKEDNTEDKERFSHFDASDVQAAIKKGFLAGDYRLSLLSNDHLKALKLSELDSSIIYQMFPQKEDNTEDQERFSHFEASDVQAAIKKGFLAGGYRLSLLSNDHWRQIDFTQFENIDLVYFQTASSGWVTMG